MLYVFVVSSCMRFCLMRSGVMLVRCIVLVASRSWNILQDVSKSKRLVVWVWIEFFPYLELFC